MTTLGRAFLAVMLLNACSPPEPVELDAGTQLDAGLRLDAGTQTVDAGTQTVDAGTQALDAGTRCGDATLDDDELCDSDTVACTSLGKVYASGTATCRPNCTGYAVTTCVRSSQFAEVAMPAHRMPERFANALCNDGTPFDFSFTPSPTGSTKWIINFEGGGRCDGTFYTCAGRPTILTSSKGTGDGKVPTNIGDDTVFSRDPAVNPELFDANFLKAHYCSSDIWTGTNATKQMVPVGGGQKAAVVFTGRINARAMIDLARRNYGLDDATAQILVTGGSAGGFGAVQNVDQIAERMPLTVANRRIAVFASSFFRSGLFNDPKFLLLGQSVPEPEVNRRIGIIYQGQFNQACARVVADAGLPAESCGNGATVVSAIVNSPPNGLGIRAFIGNNRVDQSVLSDYGIPYLSSRNSADELAARATWKAQMTSTMSTLPWIYAPADDARLIDLPDGGTQEELNLHGCFSDPLLWDYVLPTGTTLHAMFSRFWNSPSGTPGEQALFEGDVPHTNRVQ